MLEQKLEKKLLDQLEALKLEGVAFVGAWQPAAAGAIKGVESAARGICTLKVSPRSYENANWSEASFAVTLTLNVRADLDATGADLVSVTEKIISVFQPYQRHTNFDAMFAAYAIENEFTPTGFRLDGGDCGISPDDGLWVWTQNFNIQGVIE